MAPKVTQDDILKLEEIAFRAWPALEVHQYDGWLLRFAANFSKRNNSINPMSAGVLQDTAAKIAHCEQEYTQRGQDVHFRLTDAAQPAALDQMLEARGYRRWDETEVRVADLRAQEWVLDDRFRWSDQPTARWVDAFTQMNGLSSERRDALIKILGRIQHSACYGWIDDAAVGLAVQEQDHLGLFDIVVHKKQRQQGIGRALVSSLLAWGRYEGATTGYLQVTATNIAAIKLYRRFGFEVHHLYWYRTKPLPTHDRLLADDKSTQPGAKDTNRMQPDS